MPKEFKEVAIYDDGFAHSASGVSKSRLEIFSMMADDGWRFLCSTPPDRSAAMCEHWVPEVLTFDRDTPVQPST